MAQALVGTVVSIGLNYAISTLLAEDIETNIVGPRLSDLSPGDSEYGRVIPLAFGTIRAPGNLVWADELEEVVIVDEDDSGGKGGPSQTTTTTTFRYFDSFRCQFAIGFTLAERILRIFANGQLIYDATVDPITGMPTSEIFWKYGDVAPLPRFYPGGAGNLPDPVEEAVLGAGMAPGYRFTVCIFFERLPLEDFGNRLPLISSTIAFSTDDTFPSVASTGGEVDDRDIFAIDRQRGIFAAGDFISDDVIDFHSFTTASVVSKFDISAQVQSGAQLLSMAIDEATGLAYLGIKLNSLENRFYQVDPMTATILAVSDDLQTGGANTEPRARSTAFSKRNAVPDLQGMTPTFVICGVGALTGIVLMRIGPGFTREDRVSLGTSTEGFSVAAITDKDGFVWLLTDPASGGSQSYLVRCEALPIANPTTGATYQLSTLSVALTGVTEARGMAYDEASHSFVIAGTDSGAGGEGIFKFDIGSMSVVDSLTAADAGFDFLELSAQSNFSNGGVSGLLNGATLALVDDNADIRLLNVATFEFDRAGAPVANLLSDFNPGELGGITPVYYDGRSNSIVGVLDTPASDSVRRMFLDRATAAGVGLDDVVLGISFFSGLGVGLGGRPVQIDVTSLSSDVVEGYLLDSIQKSADILKVFAMAYDFEATEIDGLLTFVKKPQSTLRTITLDDLSCDEDEPQDNPFEEERVQDVEVPASVEVQYYDLARDYQKGSQSSKRITFPRTTFLGSSARTLSLPLAFSADQAKAVADRVLFTAHNERDRLKIQTRYTQVDLDPTDCIEIQIGPDVKKLRILSTELGDNGVLLVEGVLQEDGTYSSDALSSPGMGGGQALVDVGNSEWEPIDSVLLRDADNPGLSGQSLVYSAMSGRDANFRGGVIYRQSGSSFAQFDATTFVSGYGFAVDTLPDFDATADYTWDRTTTLTILAAVGGDQLSSETEANVLAGANAFLIGREIVQAAVITDNMDDTYTLSTLLRGRRGSEALGTNHGPGERVTFLSSNIHKVFVPLSDIGVSTNYRHVPFGRSLDLAISTQHVHQGLSLMPLKPHRLRMEEDAPASADMTITGLRQTRVGGPSDLNDSVGDVPEVDMPLAYEVYVLADPADDIANAVRVFTGTDITIGSASVDGWDFQVVYTSAQRTADSMTGEVHVACYQVSPLVGRGFRSDASSEDPYVGVGL